MGRLPLLLALLVLGTPIACSRPATPAVSAPADATQRRIDSGELVGVVTEGGAHAWLGIPYAAAPVGDRRWRAPAAPAAWQGTREAVAHGSPCPQFPSPFAGVEGRSGRVVGDEDCLTLDVYAPPGAGSGGRRLPVMFWIHGGGNSIGRGGNYEGSSLAIHQNVVVVTINYRLGPLGWFRHGSLRDPATDSRDRSGNFGTLDQIAALRWVRSQIHAFGGDPGNVTIFGESAGGRNVLALLVAPDAAELFHRAVVQSGSTSSMTADEGEALAEGSSPGHANSSGEILLRLLVADGRAPDRAAARAHVAGMEPADVAAFLRGLPAETLLGAYTTEATENLIDFPQVFRDGVVLPEEAFLERFATGRYNRVPTLLGTNRDEQKLFMAVDPRFVRTAFGLPLWRKDADHYEARAEHFTRAWKAIGADEPAIAMSPHQPDGIFVYRFDWDEEPRLLWVDLATLVGAAHGLEIPFVFGYFDLGRRAEVLFDDDNLPGREALSQRMQSYWAQFARTGNPGRGTDGSELRWEPWKNPAPRFLVFDTEADGGVRHAEGALRFEDVAAAVFEDPRLTEASKRCGLLTELVDARRIPEALLARAGDGACRLDAVAAQPPGE